MNEAEIQRQKEIKEAENEHIVRAPRHISCKGDGRGAVDEVLVWNGS